MPKGMRAVRDRIHTLLTTQSGLQRELPAPLRKDAVAASGPVDVPSQVAPSYLLLLAGERGNTPLDQIGGSRTMRRSTWQLRLSVFQGADVQEADATLCDLWEDVVQVLEDPSNHERTTTGWLLAGAFVAEAGGELNSRRWLNCKFDTVYDVDLGAI